MNNEIQKIESWLQEQVAPFANKIDGNSQNLAAIIQQMGDRSWLALKAPRELGGMGWSEAEYCHLQISLARVSGALTFLQTQHQSAVAKLAQSDNKSLQQEFFPDVVQGKSLIGVGFSHLRRPGTPMMQATAINEGYLLTGKVPWITGYGFFDHFILGATLTDGKEIYGILPLQNTADSGGEIICSEPMELLAATATNTVSAKVHQWYLPSDRVVSINPAGTIHRSSQKNILNHAFYALGCAYAGLDILQTIAKTKQLKFLHSSWQALHQEVKETESKASLFISSAQFSYPERLQLRAEAIDLAQRCSLAAVVASSGAANYLHSTAGRIYREALLFSVAGQTTDVMEASLMSLLSTKLNVDSFLLDN